MSEQLVLDHLKILLPAGTTVAPQSVYLRQGITPQTALWPALMLSIPLADDEQVTLGGAGYGAFQTTHVCHVLYLDRWESGSRSYEQIMADANDQVTQMLMNIRSNPALRVNNVDGCMEVAHIQKRMLGPLDSMSWDSPPSKPSS